MIRYSLYKRVYNLIMRQVFRLVFSHKFKYFGKKVTLLSPDSIIGEEYISLDDYVIINSMAWLLAFKQKDNQPNLSIGKHVNIGRFSHIVAFSSIIIEENVLIADKVYISDNIHAYENIHMPIVEQDVLFKGEVIIGKNSWIGENVSIIGAKIGEHCIVGANSVVTSNLPSYSVAVGIPAKVIKKYNFKENKWEMV